MDSMTPGKENDWDIVRAEVWTRVAVAISQCENCKSPDIPGLYADRALEVFDKTFAHKLKIRHSITDNQ